MTRPALLGSLSRSITPKIVGLICHDKPYLSLSQPHAPSSPPSVSFFQSSSTSSCVLQSTENDTASVNLNGGPLFSAMKFCPSIWNSTVITVPAGLLCTSYPSFPYCLSFS